MKKSFLIALAVLLLMGCRDGNRMVGRHLAMVDSLLNRELVDSALHELDRMDTTLLDEGTRAYYDLLRVETCWKAYVPVTSDTLLDLSLAYFLKHGPVELLARTYYYKGVVQKELAEQLSLHASRLTKNEERSRLKGEAVENLKRAEQLIMKNEQLTADEEELKNITLLKSKICIALEDVNFSAGEYEEALRYAKQAVAYCRGLDNPKLLLEDYEVLAVAWHHAGEPDSASYYFEQCMPLIEHVRPEEQAHVLANLGVYYKNMGWPQRAEELLLRSVALEPQGFAYRSLGSLCADRGEYEKAEEYYKLALALAERTDTRISTLRGYRELKELQSDYRAADALAGEISLLKDSLGRLRRIEAVGQKQRDFDHQVVVDEQLTVNSEKLKLKNAAVALLLLLLLLTVGYYYYWMRQTSRRMRADQHAIAENAMAIEALRKEKRRQGDQLRRAEERLEQLQQKQNEAVAALRERYAEQLSHGKQLYDELQNGGNVVKWQRQDRADFEAFCCMTDAVFAVKFDRDYGKCTPNQRMFLLLQHMGLSEGKIQQAMGMSDKAWQMMKLRLKG